MVRLLSEVPRVVVAGEVKNYDGQGSVPDCRSLKALLRRTGGGVDEELGITPSEARMRGWVVC